MSTIHLIEVKLDELNTEYCPEGEVRPAFDSICTFGNTANECRWKKSHGDYCDRLHYTPGTSRVMRERGH